MASTNKPHSPNPMGMTLRARSGFFISRLFANSSLRTKLIAAFLVVSILSVGAMVSITNLVAQNELTGQVGQNLKDTARTQAGRVDNILAKQLEVMQSFGLNVAVEHAMKDISDAYTGDSAEIAAEIEKLDRQWQAAVKADNNADPLVTARLNNEMAKELGGFRDRFPDNQELMIADKYGALAAATSRPPTYNLANEAWWQVAYNNGQGSLYIGQPVLDETRNEVFVTMAVPLVYQDDSVVGVLRSDFPLREIREILEEFGSRGGADLLVKEGKIFREEGDIVPLDETTLAQLREYADADYSEFFYDDGYSLVSQAPIISTDPEEAATIDRLGWVLILDEDPAVVLAPVDTVTWTILLVGLGVLILAGLAALLVSQLLTGPITRLTGVARQITAGDLNIQARVESGDEVGVLGASFNTMVNQLRQSLGQVVTRINQIEGMILNVSQRFSAILDLDALMREVVTITKETFNYYHVHIYLLDETQETLVLAEGYGQVGAEMKRQGHQIPLNAPKSLVARAARENTLVTVENVRLNPDWLPNPLLPETHSEMAIPVVLEEETVGVLDVQSDKIGGLTDEDQVILQFLANQIAIATHNARVFSDTQIALREAQKLQQLYTGQVWERFSTTQTTDYEFRQDTVPPLQEVTTPEAIAALQRERTVVLGAPTSEFNPEDLDHQPPLLDSSTSNPSALATPLKLHNKVIGVLGLHDENPNRHWTEDEIALIEAISEQMSLAIENARLFDETQRNAWRDQVVSESTAQVWSSSEIEEVMRAAVAQLGDKLRASEVVIRLGTETELAQE